MSAPNQATHNNNSTQHKHNHTSEERNEIEATKKMFARTSTFLIPVFICVALKRHHCTQLLPSGCPLFPSHFSARLFVALGSVCSSSIFQYTYAVCHTVDLSADDPVAMALLNARAHQLKHAFSPSFPLHELLLQLEGETIYDICHIAVIKYASKL